MENAYKLCAGKRSERITLNPLTPAEYGDTSMIVEKRVGGEWKRLELTLNASAVKKLLAILDEIKLLSDLQRLQ